MSTQRIDVRKDFTVAFDVNLGANDAGADGAAIVFHNDPRGANAIGSDGSGLAVGGIQNGLAIEFDTYDSTAADLARRHAWLRHRRRPHRFPRHRQRLRHHAGGPAQYRGRRVASRRRHLECGNADAELHLRWPADGNAAHQRHRYPVPRRLELRLFRLRRRHRRIDQHPKRAQHQRHRHLRRPGARQQPPHRDCRYGDDGGRHCGQHRRARQ